MNDFEKLYAINVNDKTEEKEGLTYLSWAWAWAEFKKVHPDATYEVKKFGSGLPYVYDENTGYMVFTSVTVDDLTHEMWLPVMDAHNRAMRNRPYSVKTKYKEITVQPATMFDVNKTLMRCLVKNLAMFGLGLYIYAGEDLPDIEPTIDAKQIQKLQNCADAVGITTEQICKTFHVDALSELTQSLWRHALQMLENEKAKKEEKNG